MQSVFFADDCNFIGCGSHSVAIYGLEGSEFEENPPFSQISNCSIRGSTTGIYAGNLPEIVISQNIITTTDLGINLINIADPLVSNNQITSTRNSEPGICFLSCNGSIRGNNIQGHSNGIYLGNSSPKIGGNIITDNLYHGIYVGTGSLPDMKAALMGHPPVWYAAAGYNNIYENGGWSSPGPEDNDGSEIYLNFSDLDMRKGCNEIKDIREPDLEGNVPLENTLYLMNGIGHDPFEVYVDGNYWGEHPVYHLEDRFGNLTAYFEPIVLSACSIPQEAEEYEIKSASGETIDTVYALQCTVENLTATELLYSIADGSFESAKLDSAELIYHQIITGSDPLEIKLPAYRRLYDTGRLTKKPAGYFDSLYTSFITNGSQTGDSLMKKIFTQLGSLSLIGKTAYISAIDEFDQVIQNSPNTEEVLYAEIDAMTTALLLGDDSTLNKSTASKYIKKSGKDYLASLDNLLKKTFGSNPKPQQIILPKEYCLYQNYPNPFNPITIIRYDIPDNSMVDVSVYDILGRHIKTLVGNEVKQPGTYEIRFDASGLSSGIYFYRLTSEKYTSTRKLMLLK